MGQLLLCDDCPMSFCSSCVSKNFGAAELARIRRLDGRWSCFVCSPDKLRDYCKCNGWPVPVFCSTVASTSLRSYDEAFSNLMGPSSGIDDKKSRSHQKRDHNVICYDVSRGRENIEIPVVNDVDLCPPPLDFVYVTKNLPGKDVSITTNPDRLQCCQCLNDCSDPATCSCLRLMDGRAYDSGVLQSDKSATGVYECNSRCSCHLNACKNRVVGKGSPPSSSVSRRSHQNICAAGPSLKLEVFRCPQRGKGWGVRCRTVIMSGTYIADYLGELIPEQGADARGLNYSDEYLFNLGTTLTCYFRSFSCPNYLMTCHQKISSDVSVRATTYLILVSNVVWTQWTKGVTWTCRPWTKRTFGGCSQRMRTPALCLGSSNLKQ